MKTMQRMFLFMYRAAEWSLIAAALVLVLLVLCGIYPYAVRTGSMEPAIPEGSVCFVNRNVQFEDVHKEDIIAFRIGEMLVTHRAVRIDAEGITTRGDANSTEDAVKVTRENFIGRTVYCVPYLGRVLFYVRSGKGRIGCISALVLFLSAGTVLDQMAGVQKSGEDETALECDRIDEYNMRR